MNINEFGENGRERGQTLIWDSVVKYGDSPEYTGRMASLKIKK